MWFAFKKLYLCSDEQLQWWRAWKTLGCDLLSKNCIFVLTNNTKYVRRDKQTLWFAFKKLYLCSDEQHNHNNPDHNPGCDLLSKNCIFVLTNNLHLIFLFEHYVVICFQKIVSLFWRTTKEIVKREQVELWFAFKKLYLCSDEQHIQQLANIPVRCDLLSKNCIFVLTNNSSVSQVRCRSVVICFQKIVSLFWRTTRAFCYIIRFWLWFAFKKLYLCSDEQLIS